VIASEGNGDRWISVDFSRKGSPRTKERRTEAVRTRRFKPGFVVRDGGLLLPVEVGLEAGWPPEISPEVEGAGGAEGGGAGASPAAISAIAQVAGGGPAGAV